MNQETIPTVTVPKQSYPQFLASTVLDTGATRHKARAKIAIALLAKNGITWTEPTEEELNAVTFADVR
jgi:hypothetical protein